MDCYFYISHTWYCPIGLRKQTELVQIRPRNFSR